MTSAVSDGLCGLEWPLQSRMASAVSADCRSLGWLLLSWLTPAVSGHDKRAPRRQRIVVKCWFAYLQNADRSLKKCGWSHLHQSVFITKRRWTSRKYWWNFISAWVYSPQNASGSWCAWVYSPQNASESWCAWVYSPQNADGLLGNIECKYRWRNMRLSGRKIGWGHTSQMRLKSIKWVSTCE